MVVDIATLTDACTIALGDDIAGLFSNESAVVDVVEDAARAAGEAVWALPLARRYGHRLRSGVADTANFPGNRTDRAITAALFLEQFVPARTPWAHLDVAAPVWDADNESPWGHRIRGVRTLRRLIQMMGQCEPARPMADSCNVLG
jgi:leucyl aminopeptidase